MSSAKTAAVKVQAIRFFEDGSGAESLVEVAGFLYSLNTLGATTLHLVRAPRGASRSESKIAARRARSAYEEKRAQSAPAGWAQRNAAMYADRASY
jgi:hypothetical protein